MADLKALGDFPIAATLLPQPFHFRRELASGRGPSMRLPILASLVDSRFHAIPQNIPLELRKHGQHTGQRPPAWGRQVESFRQGDEPDLEGGQPPGAC